MVILINISKHRMRKLYQVLYNYKSNLNTSIKRRNESILKTLESMRKDRFWDEQFRFGGVDFTEKNIFWGNKMLLCQWRKSGLESYNNISLLWAKATCKRGFLACLKELVTNWKTNVPFWKTTYKLMFYDHNSI